LRQNEEVEPQALSILDTAKSLSIGKTSVYNLIKKGKLPLFKIGARSVIRREDIDAFLAGGCEVAPKMDRAA
jgi:putative molybdopterin biosynthesis protein